MLDWDVEHGDDVSGGGGSCDGSGGGLGDGTGSGYGSGGGFGDGSGGGSGAGSGYGSSHGSGDGDGDGEGHRRRAMRVGASVQQTDARERGVEMNTPFEVGQWVLVRTYGAGVHVGRFRSMEEHAVVLTEARRIWRWRGANTCSELALHGAAETHTRIAEAVPVIVLPTATELIPVSPGAVESLTRSRWPT